MEKKLENELPFEKRNQRPDPYARHFAVLQNLVRFLDTVRAAPMFGALTRQPKFPFRSESIKVNRRKRVPPRGGSVEAAGGCAARRKRRATTGHRPTGASAQTLR